MNQSAEHPDADPQQERSNGAIRIEGGTFVKDLTAAIRRGPVARLAFGRGI
jgi:hypothetical protein